MPTLFSVLARSAAIAVGLTGTAMAQNSPDPPLLEGRVAWQHTVKVDDIRINPWQLLVLADRDRGLFVASLAEAPALPNGSVPLVPSVTRHDAAGRVLWSRQLAPTSHAPGRANLAGSFAADGSPWLVIPGATEKGASAAMAKLDAADGRVLQQRALTFPRDPHFAGEHGGQPTHFLPLPDGSVFLFGTGPADDWWLAWRDVAGGTWDLRLKKPTPYAAHAGLFRHQDGTVSLLAFKHPDQSWVMRVSREGQAGSWKRLPSMTSLLPAGGTIAYLEDEKDRGSRTLKKLDPATNRMTTLRTSIPPLHTGMNFGPVDLTDVTSDGAFVMRAPWRLRSAPKPQDYREAIMVSRDGQKIWRIPLRMWDQVIDSRSALHIEPVAGAWQACRSGKCPGWIVSLVTHPP